jgi:hypothetical protein
MSAQISPAQLEYYEEHASDNQQPNLIAMIVFCLALPRIAVLPRLLARWRTKAGCKADDWLILLALVQSTSSNANQWEEGGLADIATDSVCRSDY